MAREDEGLTEIATSGPWVIFEVADSEIVSPLENEPAVVEGADKNSKSWLHVGEDFFLDPATWNVELAASGPDEWQRVQVGQVPEERPLQPVEVTNITTDDDRISFDVDQVGVPVLVKASYFPNWQASGADGPWRVTPNLMVVVPTSEHVSLHYGRTPIDIAGILLTLLGFAGLIWLIRSPALVFPAPNERPGAAPDHDEGWDADDTSSTDELWEDWDQWETDDDWQPDMADPGGDSRPLQ
jgi:hypothetical protein